MKKQLIILVLIICFISFSVPAEAVSFDVDHIYNSVFVIESGNYMGSGFAIDEHLIVTNAHVIDSKRSIVVYSYNNETNRASLAGYDAEKDIAVLYVQDASFDPITIGDISTVKAGDDVYAIGAPKNLSYTLTKGIISNKNREFYGMSYLQIDAAVNEGNSGGPLLNSAGEVIGVNTLKMLDTEGIALSIPIDIIVEFIENISTETDEIPANESTNTTNSEEEVLTTDEFESSPNSIMIDSEESVCKPVFYTVCGFAGMSVIINIILLIVLLYRKRKDIVPQLDQSDRTDFEIDIME